MAAGLIHSACPKCSAVYSRLQASAANDAVTCRECGHRFAFNQNIQKLYSDPLVRPFQAHRRAEEKMAAANRFPDLEAPEAKKPNNVGHHASFSPGGMGKSIESYIEQNLLDSPSISFKNPSNDYVETVPRLVWLWVLVFGFIYFAIKGVWTHAIAGLVLAFMTMGLSWLVYPFFARSIMRTHYLRRGWIELPGSSKSI